MHVGKGFNRLEKGFTAWKGFYSLHTPGWLCRELFSWLGTPSSLRAVFAHASSRLPRLCKQRPREPPAPPQYRGNVAEAGFANSPSVQINFIIRSCTS